MNLRQHKRRACAGMARRLGELTRLQRIIWLEYGGEPGRPGSRHLCWYWRDQLDRDVWGGPRGFAHADQIR